MLGALFRGAVAFLIGIVKLPLLPLHLIRRFWLQTSPGVTPQPLLQDSETLSPSDDADKTFVEIKAIVYGSCPTDPDNDDRFGPHQRRLELTLRPALPASAKTKEEKIKWLDRFFWRISRDMKHNRDWYCEFCTDEAHEIVKMNATWVRLTPPMAKSYIHNVCDAETGTCAEYLRIMDKEMARMSGHPPTLAPTKTKFRKESKIPPTSGTCAFCRNPDEESRARLTACPKCNLTRYCSPACRRLDKSRHKMCCEAVKEVKWHWP
ncbi:hypothetical protein R3P38DRAFT_2860441 [Favolaschia claudopus]|uniref:MYND-type domain-containing protein n=1 Tax=Favolaschia claudopus TaxID=2862362 RepID=A0AAW0DLD6_9AGAR